MSTHDCVPEWLERIRTASAASAPLCLQGGGTKAFYGNPTQGESLDTREHAGIVSYEPAELVISARCGTSLREIETTLHAHQQMLAFEPPHFGSSATLGGCVSAGLSGPRRVAAGGVRDYVLGVEMIDGRGTLQSFGGQVMKNVAGYDVSRLMCGALGTLGLITRISLKVLPRPRAECTLHFEMASAAALTKLIEWAQRPLPLSASVIDEGGLRVRLSGASSAVNAAQRQLGGEVISSPLADNYWLQLREQTGEFFRNAARDLPLWRLSVAPTAPPLTLPGKELIEWHGALRWLRTTASAAELRAAAAAAGGHATLFRGGDGSIPAFTPATPVSLELQARLKRSFDPHGIFNRGRLHREF